MKNDSSPAQPAKPIRFHLCMLVFTFLWAGSFGHTLGGYVEELSFVSFPGDDRSNVQINNLLQLRSNTQWNPCQPVTIIASGRILWYGGQNFKDGSTVAAQLRNDPGVLNMAWAQGSDGTPLVLYEKIDRLSIGLSKDNFSATLGRQRINWGTNLIWNPNDWFNAFNFLDFAYPEHGGSDALHLQYYPTPTSTAEVALRPGRAASDRTLAALYKFNRWAYDWQFQAGLSGKDLATGFSWSGSIMGGGFRGELSWYYPVIDKEISGGAVVVTSASGDYTFANSLYFQISALYNGFSGSGSNSMLFANNGQVTAKSLLPVKYALYGETAYQLNPLVRLDFAAVASPTDGSFYISPSGTVSVLDNLDFIVLGQLFNGNGNDFFGSTADVITASLKYSF
jgi:hypothetical protein